MRNYGKNKIFVEGQGDKKFIDYLLLVFFGIDDANIVIDVRGKDKLKLNTDFKSEERIASNAKNLIIFDTDSSKNEGGRKAKLDWLLALDKDFLVYLLPFNDEREGVLEDLLDTCINREFSFFDDCWRSMIDCVSKSDFKALNLPAQKAFLYSKIDLFKNYRSKKWDYKGATKYDYDDKNIWNINPENNLEIKKILDFIELNLFF